jgi:hypothetical protein
MPDRKKSSRKLGAQMTDKDQAREALNSLKQELETITSARNVAVDQLALIRNFATSRGDALRAAELAEAQSKKAGESLAAAMTKAQAALAAAGRPRDDDPNKAAIIAEATQAEDEAKTTAQKAERLVQQARSAAASARSLADKKLS